MRETAFIKQNKNKWLAFEKAIKYPNQTNPDVLSNLLIQVMNDLAYAKTYYPKSKLIQYLNALSANSYNQIYHSRKQKSGFNYFWTVDVPLTLYRHKNYFYFSFLLYTIFFLIGWFSSIYEPDFLRSIIGDQYVNKTLDNIQNGDPLAVYNNHSSLGDFNSFLSIVLNNLQVGFKTIIWGLPFGIGSIFVMMQNAIMIGSFQQFFYENDTFFLSLRTIWIHGSMEIFAMCIEVGAGILLGLGFVFPGSLTRKQAFLNKGKSVVKILLSTVPFTIIAAIMEGFITQYANEMPIYIAWGIVILTLGIISFYYLIYPYIVYKINHRNLDITFNDLAYEKD